MDFQFLVLDIRLSCYAEMYESDVIKKCHQFI